MLQTRCRCSRATVCHRKHHVLPCHHVCLQDKLSTCPLIDKGGYYVSSTGKRLAHGDACNSGLSALIPDTDGKGSLNPGMVKHVGYPQAVWAAGCLLAGQVQQQL